MKNNHVKRYLCLFIALIFISTSFLLTGCTKKEPVNNTDNSTTEKNVDNQDSSQEENIDPLGKYDEPIEITAVLGFNPPEDPKTLKDVTPETQSWIKACEEQLNIKLKFLWTVPSEQYQQKFGVALASGEIPDLLNLDKKEYENLYETGQLADLTEAYEKYASPLLKQYVEADGGTTLNTIKKDGKIFAIPNYTDPKQAVQILWIREDWLRNVNLEPPKTIDDLEKIAEAFVNNDPDRNGQADTLGLAVQGMPFSWGFDLRGYFYGFGSYPKKWIKDSTGSLVAGEIQPQTKDALVKLQSMYNKGLIDKEFATKDIDKVVEQIVSGKIGLVYGEWWYPAWPLNMSMENDPNAEWKCYPLPSVDGAPAKTAIDTIMLNTLQSVSAKCKHPEAAIKMMNLYADFSQKKYGDIATPEGGFVYTWVPQRIYYPLQIEHIYNFCNDALKANKDPDAVVDPYNVGADTIYKQSVEWLNGDKDYTKWGFYFARVAEDGGWAVTKNIFDSGNVVRNEYFGTATPTMQEKGASFEKMMNETFDRIIMGADISEFDKYVENWKKLGGDDMTKEVNDWYKENVK